MTTLYDTYYGPSSKGKRKTHRAWRHAVGFSWVLTFHRKAQDQN